MTAKRKEVRFLPVPGMEGGDAGEPRSGFAGLLGCFSGLVAPGPTEYVAIKIHAGEKGNSNFLRPHQVMGVIEGLSLPREQVFLTDTTVLYRGYRMSAPAYVTLAREHGYGLPETPPFLVADGLRGTDDVVVMLPSPCEL
ncbi:DUF362 domain-containing protein, partial [Candidatus Fermentibacterales bacterium]|nr:DUF362 domain-containing protein [Candidatus Fermentibacterales bacterium]